MTSRKPKIAMVLGDPAGIGPELVARLLADPATGAAADLLLIADQPELERGMQAADMDPHTVVAHPRMHQLIARKPVLKG